MHLRRIKLQVLYIHILVKIAFEIIYELGNMGTLIMLNINQLPVHFSIYTILGNSYCENMFGVIIYFMLMFQLKTLQHF